MTKQRDPEALLAAYLAGGMDVLPDRVVESVLAEVHRTRRRRTISSWTPPTFRSTLATATVVAALVVGGAFVVWAGTRPAVTTPIPIASATPAPSSTRTPTVAIPPAGAWVATGSMGTPRFGHTAVRLLDGRLLVVGGYSGRGADGGYAVQTTSAEVYDPETGIWSATGDMSTPPKSFPATLLRDGRVLVGDGGRGAELYDPDSGIWSATRPMVRGGVEATLLRDGTVLVTGNEGSELYDPDDGTWTATPSVGTQRHSHAAILLPDGDVLVAGGHSPGDDPAVTAELYDPETGSWTSIASMNAAREAIEAFPRPDGKVLVVGGPYKGGALSADLYDPVTGTWAAVGERSSEHRPSNPAITAMSDGTVLVTGDRLFQLYDPDTGIWSAGGTMPGLHTQATATLLSDGTVLLAGGGCPGESECVASGFSEVYVPTGVSAPTDLATPGPTPIPTQRPTPTPIPTPFPAAEGIVPAGARPWQVTVINSSAEAATLFVAEEDETGMTRLVGSASPNVVPPGATVKVTFLLPAADANGWWIFVNPAPRTGALLGPDDVPRATGIFIGSDGQPSWASQ